MNSEPEILNPEPTTLNPEPPALKTFTRRPITHQGKVARLPAATRNQVCQMMYDGTRYRTIIAWLAENAFPGFHKCNLSRWRDGGYQDWLKAQQWFEHRDFKRDLATEQAKTDDPAFHDAAVYLAQIQFYEALNRLDGAELSQLVRENRKEFIQLLKTFTHFNRYCLQREKFRNDLQRQDKAEQVRNQPSKRPLRTVTMEKICDDLNLK
jgi:hypothetical protein